MSTRIGVNLDRRGDLQYMMEEGAGADNPPKDRIWIQARGWIGE
jgi:hypothetical protein